METMSDFNFPMLKHGEIAGESVQTVNARDLHSSLKVGKDFSNWIKDRIEKYGFVENQDFMVFAEIGENPQGGRPAKEYAITLDMAKELGMVERNERGRLIRQYFIAMEKQARTFSLSIADVTGIVDQKLQQALPPLIEALIDRLVDARIATQAFTIRRGVTSGQVWKRYNLPKLKNGHLWLGNRLVEMSAQIENSGRGELGLSTARLFDPDKVAICMRNGLEATAQRYAGERLGQQRLRLVGGITPD